MVESVLPEAEDKSASPPREQATQHIRVATIQNRIYTLHRLQSPVDRFRVIAAPIGTFGVPAFSISYVFGGRFPK
jgi:hypothetical protein